MTTLMLPTHIPAFEGPTISVESVEDLDRIEWVRSWRKDPSFYRFSMDRRDGNGFARLMAEFAGGKRATVVGLLDVNLVGLPDFEPPDRTEKAS